MDSNHSSKASEVETLKELLTATMSDATMIIKTLKHWSSFMYSKASQTKVVSSSRLAASSLKNVSFF